MLLCCFPGSKYLGAVKVKIVEYEKYGEADVLNIVDRTAPIPADGEVLINIRAAGVNPFDWKLRSGYLQKFFKVEFPVYPGNEGSGVVAAVGPGVTNFKAGDEVSFLSRNIKQGCYAEQVAIETEHVVPKADHISFAEAAAWPLSGVTAWKALVETAPISKDMKVLIHGGAGGVGGMAIQIAKHRGAHVATTCSAANAEYVKSLGADEVIAYDNEDFSTAGKIYDIVFDTVGGDVHKNSYEVLKPGGTLVWIIAGPVEDLSEEFGVIRKLAVVENVVDALEGVAGLINDRVARPQVGPEFDLSDVAAAHIHSQSGHAKGKVILAIS
jgi:NADPH:quinone reductase-like Zn-dependent oxidoreductase